MAPVQIRCGLCERRVNKVEVLRNYHRRGLTVTVWTHEWGFRCFIADDLHEDAATAGRPDAIFEFHPHTETQI